MRLQNTLFIIFLLFSSFPAILYAQQIPCQQIQRVGRIEAGTAGMVAGTTNNCNQLICDDGYHLVGNLCKPDNVVPICTGATYVSGLTCANCPTGCATCSNGFSCSTCISNYYFSGSLCVQTCPVGEYGNPSNNQCTSCTNLHPSCLTCSPGQCNSCSSGPPSGSTCTNCASGSFFNGATCESCTSLHPSCLACSPGQCISCSIGTPSGATCAPPNCGSGTFLNGANCESCTIVHNSCTTCSSSSQCNSCSGNYYLSGSTCVDTCPAGEYGNPSDHKCTSCTNLHNLCTSCTATQCNACSNGWLAYGTSCEQNCPAQTYPIAGKCQSCATLHSSCTSCTATQCNACSNGWLAHGTQCRENCPAGTSPNNGVCQNCGSLHPSCTSCSAGQCTVCSGGLYGYGATCEQNCPGGTYPSGGSCISCASLHGSCTTCSSSSQCNSCSNSWLADGDTCVPGCPSGKYSDGVKCQRCTSLHGSCATCSSASQCESCSNSLLADGNTCVPGCGTGKYSDTVKCHSCSSNCDSCTSNTNCETCSATYFLYHGSCHKPCPTRTYHINSNCQDCFDKCENCVDGSSCTKCVYPNVLLGTNQCLDSCPDPYYNKEGVCEHCPTGCSKCTGPNSCSACDPKYFLSGGICLECKSECKTCESLEVCHTCEPSFVFYDHQCPDTCPLGTFDLNGICTDCANGCTKCTGLQACELCEDKYYLLEGICNGCNTECATCTSPTQCQTCEPDYVFFNQNCPVTCPPETYNLNQICQPCPIGCATCTDLTKCQTCHLGYNLFSGDVCTLDVNEEQAKQVQQVTQATEAAATTSEAVGSVYGFLNSGDPSAMFMGSLAKMLQYVKYIDVVYPPKIKMMFEAQNKVNETEKSTSFITKAQNNMKGAFYNTPLPGTFGYYQLHSSFVSNFLQSLLTLGLILFLIVLLKVLTMLISSTSKVNKILTSVLDILKWNLFLIMFCGMYGDIVFYSAIEFRTMKLNEATSCLSFLICLFVNILAVLILGRLIQVNLGLKSSRKTRIARDHFTLAMEEEVNKWKDYKPFFEAYKNYSFLRQSFMLFFILRISSFYLVVAYLQDYPKLQVILINVISVLMILYLVIARPFAKVVNNLNQVTFELTLLAFNICVLLLTFYEGDTAEDFKQREKIGNVMMIINMVAGIVSMAFICIKAILSIKEIYQDWRRSKKQTQTLSKSSHKPRHESLDIVTDHNNLTTSGQILTTNSTVSHQMQMQSSMRTSDLTMSNLDQTIDMSSYVSYGTDTRPHHLLSSPQRGRINYPNFQQNLQALRPPAEQTIKSSSASRTTVETTKSSSVSRHNETIKSSSSNNKDTLHPSSNSMNNETFQSSSNSRNNETRKSSSSRNNSKIKKSKKKKAEIQEEIRRLEEKRQEQINQTRGLYSQEARKLRRPNNLNNNGFN